MATTYIRTGLARDYAPLSCKDATAVLGFTISGIQPVNTDRRIVFSYEGQGDEDPVYFKLAVAVDGTAATENVATQEITEESVLAEGNTVAELSTVTRIPDFVGKVVYPVVAFSAPEDSVSVPSLGLGISIEKGSDSYDMEEESPTYKLSDQDVNVVRVDAEADVTGKGTATVQVCFQSGGVWGDYMNIADVQNIRATAARFRARYHVTTLDGTDTARVKQVSLVYCASDARVSGNITEIITITQRFAEEQGKKGVSFAELMVVHKELIDAEIEGQASFRKNPETRKMIQIGTGTGERQTLTLPDSGINYSSVEVFVNGNPYYEFSANTATNEITVTADIGLPINASYECGWGDENWRDMELVARQVYRDTGLWMSKYQIALPFTETDMTVSALKVRLIRPEGDAAEEVLGVATGDMQVFLLDHNYRKDTITCTGQWSYDDERRILKVQADRGQDIVFSGHWIAESHEVYSLVGGWAETM